MARATTKDVVLTRVVDRLIDQIDWCNAATCFLSIHPEPLGNVDKSLYCTVAPLNGRFDDAQQVGGGEQSLFYEGGVVVTIFSAMRLDRSSQDELWLTDVARGALIRETDVLKALVDHDLQDEAGNELLTRTIYALNDSDPRRDSERQGDIQVQFGTDFLWSMS